MKPFYFALLTALVWGIVPILEKAGLLKCSPSAGLFVRCLAVMGGAFVLWVLNPGLMREVRAIPLKNIGLILVGGLGASFIGQYFFYQALKSGEASKVVPLAGAYPLVSFILGVLFFSEKVTLLKASGVGLILSGILLLK